MKTLVRIQHQSDSNNRLNLMTVQILIKPYKGSDTIDVIGHLSFQQNKGTDRWYALNFNVSTDKPEHLTKMAKLARYIKKNTNWDSQPEEIFEVIGAVKYKIFQNQFIEESKEGEYLWDVMTASDTLHSTIVAPNEKVAKRLLKKKPEGTTLKYNRKVIF
jgi:hypothetical protein